MYICMHLYVNTWYKWQSSRTVRFARYNERNVGRVYVHESAFVRTPKCINGRKGYNGHSFFPRASSMSKSEKLVTISV